MNAIGQDQQVQINIQTNKKKPFRSSKRVLAYCFKKSRDLWKKKYMILKSDNKRLKVRVSDVTKSRDNWKQKYQQEQHELKSLQAQMQNHQHELDDSKKKRGSLS